MSLDIHWLKMDMQLIQLTKLIMNHCAEKATNCQVFGHAKHP